MKEKVEMIWTGTRVRNRRPQFLSSSRESMQIRCETSGRTPIRYSEWSSLRKTRSKRKLWDTKSDQITANKFGLQAVSTNRGDNSFQSALNNWQETLRSWPPMSPESPQNRRFNRDMLARLIVRLYRDLIGGSADFFRFLDDLCFKIAIRSTIFWITELR